MLFFIVVVVSVVFVFVVFAWLGIWSLLERVVLVYLNSGFFGLLDVVRFFERCVMGFEFNVRYYLSL
jgi:hypothetical protein